MLDAANVLREGGHFSAVIPGFSAREPQIEMSVAIEETLATQGALVVEAETGTGKTLAYLVPALLSGRPIIVSTGTKSLQDQLFFKDVPMVLKALGVSRRVVQLKGRANYLCPYRLEQNLEGTSYLTRETAEQLVIVKHWAGRTRSGDFAELEELPEDAPVWPWVTSTADNCLGQECPYVDECPLMLARQAAQEADLVVVNHHLFFADAALKGEGVGELLPTAEGVIFDEAHQLPDIAATFFGKTFSSRQLTELISDVRTEVPAGADLIRLEPILKDVEQATANMRLALGTEGRRDAWHEVAEQDEVQENIEALIDALDALYTNIEPMQKSSRGLDSCIRRCEELQISFLLLTQAKDPYLVYWFETFRRAFMLHGTPLSVAEAFKAHRDKHECAWVFTSATLSVAGDFKHFLRRLGLQNAATMSLASPFDFRRQAVLYVPEQLPLPQEQRYTAALVEAMKPVITAAKGGVFFLFTSHRALREAATLLENQLPYPLLVQGTRSRRQLLEEFREAGNAVLLGAASFWEGIDVRGDALRCVIIDKLPFASPGDPVAAARIEHIKEQGRHPFMEFQVPHAVLTLRQGAGRLIRDPQDQGLLVLADPRVVSKGYGRLFLQSLPNMTRTRKLEVVQRFFRLVHENTSN